MNANELRITDLRVAEIDGLPKHMIKASSINISTTINDSISYLNYKLELLNSSGVSMRTIFTK